ncbi:MAG: HAMP domain-containing sensor histidine kinase [Bacillota bacterium]|nr:HAMP domain-containing sensor histidine kinase [Bacillota bacterium]
MFQKTHIRLTFINSIVFIVLIGILGSIIYAYTQHQLYKDVNLSLLSTVQEEVLPPNGNRPPIHREHDPRKFTLIWDQNQHLLIQNRESEVFKGNEKYVRPKVYNKLTDVTVENLSIRYFAFKVVDPILGKVTIQSIRIVNSEQELLHRLLLILCIGCGLGFICAVIAGYFLAGRALVPIKNAWQKQQQFVSDASHELRTPLAVIQAKTDLLFRSPSATIKDKIIDVSTISNESRRLSKLVSNLLILARSDSDQIEIHKQTFRLDLLLGEIIQHYEEIVTYQDKSLKLDAPGSVYFTADKERIHQLIIILLDNAIKYTNGGGEITLSCHRSHSSIFLQITDNGIGISEEEIPKIFDRFYQSDKARTVSVDAGLGLGLSIAQWIIDKHHGRVKVSSTLGKGTQIEITFPKNQKS